jgi:hypothetical protein
MVVAVTTVVLILAEPPTLGILRSLLQAEVAQW